jgi:ABC-type transport system involved in cytochrome c biogenesis ATPase subunit
MTTTAAVDAVGLVKTFGRLRAVDGIDLHVQQGEILGVLGPNGAGKTTALRMLATLLPIDAGQARVFGVDVSREPHRVRQLIGITGQDASVDEDLTATENLWMFGRLQGLRSADARAAAKRLLAQFDLEEAADKPIAQFSGGMRRRLDLAASLITRPPPLSMRRRQDRQRGRVRARPAGCPRQDHPRGGRIRGGGPPDLRERAVVPVNGPGQAGRQRQGLPRQPLGGGRVPVEHGRGGAHELREPGAVDLAWRGPQPVPGAVADDRVRTARVPGPRHQHLRALQAVARRVVSPDELDQVFRPHRAAAARRESSKQRLRAIARNRSPPPAHIGQQGQGDAHLISLESRPDGPEAFGALLTALPGAQAATSAPDRQICNVRWEYDPAYVGEAHLGRGPLFKDHNGTSHNATVTFTLTTTNRRLLRSATCTG